MRSHRLLLLLLRWRRPRLLRLLRLLLQRRLRRLRRLRFLLPLLLRLVPLLLLLPRLLLLLLLQPVLLLFLLLPWKLLLPLLNHILLPRRLRRRCPRCPGGPLLLGGLRLCRRSRLLGRRLHADKLRRLGPAGGAGAALGALLQHPRGHMGRLRRSVPAADHGVGGRRAVGSLPATARLC